MSTRFFVNTKKNNGKDRETVSRAIALEIREIHIQMLELIGRWIWRGPQKFIQCYQEKIQQPPLQHSALFALRQLCMYLMTFQIITIGILKYADISGIRLLFNYNVSKIHISYLHNITTKCHASTSHPGVSSPRLLHRGENFTPVGNLAMLSCKCKTTRDFGGK